MRNKISVHHACRTHLFPDKYIYGLNRTFSLLLNCGYIVSLCRVYVWFSQSDSPWKQEGPKRENRCIYPISLGKFLPKTHFSTSFLPKSWSHSHLLFVSPSPSDPNSTFPVKQNRQLQLPLQANQTSTSLWVIPVYKTGLITAFSKRRCLATDWVNENLG